VLPSIQPTGAKDGSLFSEELDSSRFSGQIELALQDDYEKPVRFSVTGIEYVYVAPYEVVVDPESRSE
jgi:hypothetical protein